MKIEIKIPHVNFSSLCLRHIKYQISLSVWHNANSLLILNYTIWQNWALKMFQFDIQVVAQWCHGNVPQPERFLNYFCHKRAIKNFRNNKNGSSLHSLV